jgi:hypothetical protein
MGLILPSGPSQYKGPTSFVAQTINTLPLAPAPLSRSIVYQWRRGRPPADPDGGSTGGYSVARCRCCSSCSSIAKTRVFQFVKGGRSMNGEKTFLQRQMRLAADSLGSK